VPIEVVKGNSMGDIDNFSRVLNRLPDSEVISMISARLSYTYKNTLIIFPVIFTF
jgi:hypothetical protein